MNESDWKTFRKIVPELRERYLLGRNRELRNLLDADDKSETERFWDAWEKTREVERTLRDCLDGHSRSRMFMAMARMLSAGMLQESDLNQFSEELRSRLVELGGD